MNIRPASAELIRRALPVSRASGHEPFNRSHRYVDFRTFRPAVATGNAITIQGCFVNKQGAAIKGQEKYQETLRCTENVVWECTNVVPKENTEYRREHRRCDDFKAKFDRCQIETATQNRPCFFFCFVERKLPKRTSKLPSKSGHK